MRPQLIPFFNNENIERMPPKTVIKIRIRDSSSCNRFSFKHYIKIGAL